MTKNEPSLDAGMKSITGYGSQLMSVVCKHYFNPYSRTREAIDELKRAANELACGIPEENLPMASLDTEGILTFFTFKMLTAPLETTLFPYANIERAPLRKEIDNAIIAFKNDVTKGYDNYGRLRTS